MAIDHVALLDSYKGLSVCFIISIFIINCLLIVKIVQKGGFLYNPKSLTLISLAIGDIFLALFSLVVVSRFCFEGADFNLPSSTIKSSLSYLAYLIHFVYGVGLILLAAEFVYRLKKQPQVGNTTTNIVKSVVCSAVPWFLGLIIVLPLTMSDSADTDYRGLCFNVKATDRCQAMYGVSVLLPACLAVTVCIAVMCIRLGPAAFTSGAVHYQGTTPGVVVATQNTTNVLQPYHVPPAPPATYHNQFDPQNPTIQQYQTPQYPAQQYISPPQYPAQQYIPPPQYPAQQYIPPPQYPAQQYIPPPQYPAQQYIPPPQYPAQQYIPPPQYPAQQYIPPPQYPAQQYIPPQYPAQQHIPPQYPAQQQNTQSNTIVTTPVTTGQPQYTTSPAPQDEQNEKNVLLTVSIIYFVCVVPVAAFMTALNNAFADGTYSPSEINAIIAAILFWLSVSRSVITPAIWMIRYRN